MSQRFATVIEVPRGRGEEVEKLLNSIKKQDPTFDWKPIKIQDRLHAVIYSPSKSQATKRGEWLTTNTELFKGISFRVTLEAEKTRPQETLGLREFLKRRKQWER